MKEGKVTSITAKNLVRVKDVVRFLKKMDQEAIACVAVCTDKDNTRMYPILSGGDAWQLDEKRFRLVHLEIDDTLPITTTGMIDLSDSAWEPGNIGLK